MAETSDLIKLQRKSFKISEDFKKIVKNWKLKNIAVISDLIKLQRKGFKISEDFKR